MSGLERLPPPRLERPRGSRRRPFLRAALALVVLVAAFGLGVALGEALHDSPSPGGTQTRVRTLRPLPVAPPRVTVTLTVRTG